MRKIGSLAGAALGLVLLVPGAQAQDFRSQVDLKLRKVAVMNGKGSVLLDVLNGSPKRLDIEVVCTFMNRGDDPLGKGSNMITVDPRRTDPIEVRAVQAFKFEKAACTVESAKP
jgi:hypothetical protein